MHDDGGRTVWRLRAPLLALLGVAAAVASERLLHVGPVAGVWRPRGTLEVALATAIGGGALSFALAAERVRIGWTIAFALVVALGAGLIVWWNGTPGGVQPDWWNASLLLAVATATPLFQTARDEGRAAFPYRSVHSHAWADVVLWCAACMFAGIAFLLAWLLASLFDLIGIHALSDLLRRPWVSAGVLGAALGGAIGLLREHDRVVRTVQHAVMAVLGVLAPVLAAGLALFLLALPFTGLDALWEATKATTPILLSCVIGALILVNAVIGDEDASGGGGVPSRVLRWSATVLALAMLPLAVIAAVATGLRIDQYGLTPDRLWALIAVIVANAYALAYAVAVVVGWRAWPARVRLGNLRLAFALAALALLLATPLVGFNALSVRDQLARLASGRVSPERFDWRALAFDFGAPGKAALARLARSPDPDLREHAATAMALRSRWGEMSAIVARDTLRVPVAVRPVQRALPQGLKRAAFGLSQDKDSAATTGICTTERHARCTIWWSPGEAQAIVARSGCRDSDMRYLEGRRVRICEPEAAVFALVRGRWDRIDLGRFDLPSPPLDQRRRDAAKASAAVDRGAVEVREVRRRQLFIGGTPVGQAFE